MLNCFISSFQMLHLYLVLLLSIWIWSLDKVTGREYELHWRANCSQRGSRKLDWKFTSCSPSLSGLSVRSWYIIYLNCRNLFLKHNGCQMWDRTCFPFRSDKLRSSMYLMGSCCCSSFLGGFFHVDYWLSFPHWGRRSFFNIDLRFLDIFCLSSYWIMLFRGLELVEVMKYVEPPQFLTIGFSFSLSFFWPLYPPFSDLRLLFTP